MGNFNLKNIWAPKTGGGGSIPSNLEQRVQELENNTLKLDNNQRLQIVRHGVDFYENIICKKEAFVDVVGNRNTNITNKQYVDTKDAQNVKITGDQTITGSKTFNAGAGLMTYTSTNTTKNRNEVLTRNDITYVRVINQGQFTCNANNYQTAEYTINGLTTGLNEFYVVFTTNNTDIGFELKIQCNNLSYPNMSDIKQITPSNWTNSNIDNSGIVMVGFVVSGGNKFRYRMKNTYTSNITFSGYRVYKRIPASIENS